MLNLSKYAGIMLMIYPLAVMTAVLVNMAFGEMLFADLLVYDSKRRLLSMLVHDWLKSLVWVVPGMLLATGALSLFPRLVSLILLVSLVVVAVATAVFPVIPEVLGFVVVFTMAGSLVNAARGGQ